MKLKYNIFKYLILTTITFFLFPKLSFNQKVIELLEGSDKIEFDGKTGNQIIKGNVIFKKGDSRFYCDSAYFNIIHNTIRAYGNVHLNKKDTLNMFCDSVFYDTNKEYIKLYGNVRIRNNEYKLTTDSIDYDLKKDIGIYKNKGMLTSISSSDTLSSIIGYFYPSVEQFNFRNNVVYKNSDYTITTDTLQFNSKSKKAFFFGPTNIKGDSILMYCEKGWYNLDKEIGVLENNAFIRRPELYIVADSLYYSSKDKIYIGKKNVEIIDTANQISFQGDYAINDDVKQLSFITGHALAKRFDEKDTLYIHADTLFNYNDSVGKPTLILAFYKVKLFRGDMQGVCDSLTYNRTNGEMNLYHNPVLWAKNAQLSGDTITVYEQNDEIRQAFIRNQGLIVTKVDSTTYYNQITGTTMNAFFDSTQIKKVDIIGSAKTIYFLEEETESDTTIIVERKGMNRLYASDITLRFNKGDIKTATYRQNPDGVLYPMKDIEKKEEKVESFKWDIEKRPKTWKQMIYSEEEQKTFLFVLRQVLMFVM